MKKKLLALLLSTALVATAFTACGGGGSTDNGSSTAEDDASANDDGAADDAGEADDAADDGADDADADDGEAEAEAVTTVGPDDGTPMEMWAFVEAHNTFYATMLEKWNEENPDRQIQITFTTYPYADMHNKLTMSLQTGEGAPDLCDVEIGMFPNYLLGDVQLYPLNDAIAPYEDDIVQARLDIYSKDGNYYGAPTHVGATVMYYNTEIFEEYGIDWESIETWDDYTAAGEALAEASGGEVALTSVDTGGVDWMWIAMAQYGEDWTGVTEDGTPNVQLDSVKNMLTMQKEWLDDGVAIISPDGHVDLEAGYQNIIDGRIASFPKALWYMSRFMNYMPEMEGKFALAPMPVFEEGQPRSVGVGGTGTVVTNQSADPELAADFISYAKLSYDGNLGIWEELGFDTVNTSIWEDESITKDENNQYIKFFVTNPFDVLNEIKDEIGKISVLTISPTINDAFNLTALNNIFENGMDIDEVLEDAQNEVDLEL